ncbi:hypothetical protein CHARACLAT_006360 [Characodon lateralis]|uniref:Uncharacterized protein n=1 Tax=Characodon lateralis TaxID=208331 RepID=A0ABU7CQ04_9TELE|nr:hypothetical protein [Characodon lateralis]
MGCVEMERQAAWVTMDHLTSVNPHLMRGFGSTLTTPTADMQVLPELMLSAPFLGSAVVGEEKKKLHATPHSFAEPPSGVATRTAEEVALKGKLLVDCNSKGETWNFWRSSQELVLMKMGENVKHNYLN